MDVMYALCDCYVWPVVPIGYNSVGRCGRCGARAVIDFHIDSKREGLDIFREIHHKFPKPIEAQK